LSVLIVTAIAAWGMAIPKYDPRPIELSDLWQIPTGRQIELQLNRDLVWPALALATFLVWKAAWGMVERQRMKAATYFHEAT
jgi:hypothetical protein